MEKHFQEKYKYSYTELNLFGSMIVSEAFLKSLSIYS